MNFSGVFSVDRSCHLYFREQNKIKLLRNLNYFFREIYLHHGVVLRHSVMQISIIF